MTDSIIIRKANLSDRLGIQKVHKNTVIELCSEHYDEKVIKIWTDTKHFSNEKYAYLLENEEVFVAANKLTNEIVGFTHIKIDKKIQSGYIDRLYVSARLNGKKIGSRLLKEAINVGKINNMKKIDVDSTTNAITFYLNKGFKKGLPKKWRFEGTDIDLDTISMSLQL